MISRKMMLVTGALLASPANAATNYVDVVRDLAARIGPIIGSALACDDIARRRVQMIADKFNQVIRDASPNELDRAELARLFDANVANDRRLVATAQIDCQLAERQLASRERSLGGTSPQNLGAASPDLPSLAISPAAVALTPRAPTSAESPIAKSGLEWCFPRREQERKPDAR
jgi:branched-chain amino acid transport system substrate-binding protein